MKRKIFNCRVSPWQWRLTLRAFANVINLMPVKPSKMMKRTELIKLTKIRHRKSPHPRNQSFFDSELKPKYQCPARICKCDVGGWRSFRLVLFYVLSDIQILAKHSIVPFVSPDPTYPSPQNPSPDQNHFLIWQIYCLYKLSFGCISNVVLVFLIIVFLKFFCVTL